MPAMPQNLLVIMADEHNAMAMGCAGHPFVKTPNIDRLAARGTRFTNAYTNSPICVPARAAFATGRYVYETGYWDNSFGYEGRVKSWGHALHEAGHRVESIGKLHYQNGDAPTGFDRQHIPMHLYNGTGMVQGSIRGQFPDFKPEKKFTPSLAKIIDSAGPGESAYIKYDRKIARLAVEWLQNAAARKSEKPWCLFVSFVTPHYPLIAPEEYIAPYLAMDIPLPALADYGVHPPHPWWDNKIAKPGEISEEQTRRAVASYFGLCTFMDDMTGRVLQALEASGLTDSTRVIYTSDHGECLGKRGLWGKSVMYREATEIPLIAAGEGVSASSLCATPVSLIDMYPTILEAAGVRNGDADELPGRSLFEIMKSPENPDRIAFSEYHAMASPSAAFMLRSGRFKYHYYADGFEPELFDIAADPDETKNLARDPRYAEDLARLDAALHAMLDPEAADVAAKQAQKVLIESYGGPQAVIEKFTAGGKAYTDVPAELIEEP